MEVFILSIKPLITSWTPQQIHPAAGALLVRFLAGNVATTPTRIPASETLSASWQMEPGKGLAHAQLAIFLAETAALTPKRKLASVISSVSKGMGADTKHAHVLSEIFLAVNTVTPLSEIHAFPPTSAPVLSLAYA